MSAGTQNPDLTKSEPSPINPESWTSLDIGLPGCDPLGLDLIDLDRYSVSLSDPVQGYSHQTPVVWDDSTSRSEPMESVNPEYWTRDSSVANLAEPTTGYPYFTSAACHQGVGRGSDHDVSTESKETRSSRPNTGNDGAAKRRRQYRQEVACASGR